MTDEEKNTEIIEKLRNLPRIKAGDDFMQKLESRIAEFESVKSTTGIKSIKTEKEGFFRKLFGEKRNQWLVPAMGLAAVAVFALYITKFSKNEIDERSELKNNVQIEKSATKDKKDISELNRKEENFTESKQKEIENQTEKENLSVKESPFKQKTEVNKTQPAPVESKKGDLNRDEVSSNIPETSFTGKVSESKKEENVNGNIEDSKVEKYNDGKSGMERSGILTSEPNIRGGRSTDKDIKEFEKPVDKSILDKLNKINRQKLDSLKKKVNK